MVRPGDEIYFTVGGKPATGKVLCHGKHGCTVKDSFGQVRKLKYQHVLGHKTRVDSSARVVDQGVDGAILEDDAGRRTYAHGFQTPPVPADPVVRGDAWAGVQMAKAMLEPALFVMRDVLNPLMNQSEAAINGSARNLSDIAAMKHQIGEFGARISALEAMAPGTAHIESTQTGK